MIEGQGAGGAGCAAGVDRKVQLTASVADSPVCVLSGARCCFAKIACFACFATAWKK
jgi:hypothetical protein